MVDAIRAAATNAERRAQFVADAVASRTQPVKSGQGYAAAEVHAYLRARAHGTSTSTPRAKAWRASSTLRERSPLSAATLLFSCRHKQTRRQKPGDPSPQLVKTL